MLPYEVANVLARLVFDGDLEADGIADTWSDLAALHVVLHPFDLTQDGPAVAAITTQPRRRHATDSTAIRLAQQLDTAVWTLDGPLPATRSTSAYPSGWPSDAVPRPDGLPDRFDRLMTPASEGDRSATLRTS